MTIDTDAVPTAKPATGILSGAYLWITVGACALVFLGAFCLLYTSDAADE